MICPNCGFENVDTAKFCKKCGRTMVAASPAAPAPASAMPNSQDTSPPAPAAAPGPAPAAPPSHPKKMFRSDLHRLQWGGSLVVVGGMAGLVLGPALPSVVAQAASSSALAALLVQGSILPIVLAGLGVVGGVLALLRRLFLLSVLFSALGALAIGPLFATSALGTAGVVMIAIGRREFIPIYTRKVRPEVACPDCQHPLEYEILYREWYCFNCREHKKLPLRVNVAAPAASPVPTPSPAAGPDAATEPRGEVPPETPKAMGGGVRFTTGAGGPLRARPVSRPAPEAPVANPPRPEAQVPPQAPLDATAQTAKAPVEERRSSIFGGLLRRAGATNPPNAPIVNSPIIGPRTRTPPDDPGPDAGGDQRLALIEDAFQSGRISYEQYQANLKQAKRGS